MKRHKVIIAIRDATPIAVYLTTEKRDSLMDQFYEVCSGHLDDNVLEITTNDNCNETTLVRVEEILYIRSIESIETNEQKKEA